MKLLSRSDQQLLPNIMVVHSNKPKRLSAAGVPSACSADLKVSVDTFL
jgi:hypothetical protein